MGGGKGGIMYIHRLTNTARLYASNTPARLCSTGLLSVCTGVVFQASIDSRILLVEPFPTTEALVQSNAWPVVRQ